ncbi:MAG: M48 family metallopeptidase [Bacteroidota bacterium]
MESVILYIIIAIVIFDFAFERLLAYLNYTKLSNKLPKELQGIYDEEKYRKSQDYLRVNMKFGLITSTLSFIAILLMLYFEGFGWLDNTVRQYADNTILITILFFGILGLASDLLSTPFDIYDTFVIEEKFGFNKTTYKTYILDKIKGWLLAIVLGGGLLAIFVWFYQVAGSLFWLYAWLFFSGFSIFMTMFYSTLIVPIFNKQKPLEEGELRNAIEDFAKKANFKLDNIFVIDGSKRSTKANAYFSGLGPKKRIVLFDTLIKDHTTEELVAVLAHEIGHYKKNHTLKSMAVSLVSSAIIFYLLGVFINYDVLSKALGGQEASFHLGILAFGLLYSPVSMVLGIVGNILSRKHEYQADAFAAVNYDAKPLQEALKKLSVNNLSNLRPHPLVVFVNYSHPPLLKRLSFLDKFRK